MSEFEANPQGDALAQAADWHARLLSDEASEGDWLAFEDWLRVSPEHQAAYEQIERIWIELDAAVPKAPERASHAPGRPAARPSALGRLGRWRPALAASLALFAVVGLALAIVWPRSTTYSAEGTSRIVRLADGTKIELTDHSVIHVRLRAAQRDVSMGDGAVSFDVAKDPRRPFIVSVGDRAVRVVGTNFTVVHKSGRLRVVLRRGAVDVTARKGAPGAALVHLIPGEQLVHQDGRPGSTVSQIKPRYATSFQDGRLIYSNTPLAEVVSDLNAYFLVAIRVDPDAASLVFSGVLALDSEDAVVRRLEAFLPVKAERSAQGIVLRRVQGKQE